MAFIPEIIPEIPEIIEGGEATWSAGRAAVEAWRAGRNLQAARHALEAARRAGTGIQAAERTYRAAQRHYNATHHNFGPTPPPNSPSGAPPISPASGPRPTRLRIPRTARKKSMQVVTYKYSRGKMRYKKSYRKKRGRKYKRKTSATVPRRRNRLRGYHKGKGQMMGPTRAAPRYQLVSNGWDFDYPYMNSGDKVTLELTQNNGALQLVKYIYGKFAFGWGSMGMEVGSEIGTHAYLWKGVKFVINYNIPVGLGDFKIEFFLCARAVDVDSNPSLVLGESPGVKVVPNRVMLKKQSYKVFMHRKYNMRFTASRDTIIGSDPEVTKAAYIKGGNFSPHCMFKNPVTVRFVKHTGIEYLMLGNNSTRRFPIDSLMMVVRILPVLRGSTTSGSEAVFKLASFAYVTKEVPVLYV
ncbi:putative capsid protein [Avon-Heathcote Estuary associated circular virus 20]|uniref:putative capsid protein n=1 Tax=Avon-Heathcote Estuary associated circular virus 20 TaxID=1618244 RepID=UPI0005CCA8D7|nr:putative capsid protein [Avon-Heathcote Estuary associated circular virus 20]AJP36447.1 putative capsid protein [Avon-Heathcote Estuary associated circular virus 20]AJP36450.1 putative capsid protein [Avon-Heathcote Estuary associated circular virus 20]